MAAEAEEFTFACAVKFCDNWCSWAMADCVASISDCWCSNVISGNASATSATATTDETGRTQR